VYVCVGGEVIKVGLRFEDYCAVRRYLAGGTTHKSENNEPRSATIRMERYRLTSIRLATMSVKYLWKRFLWTLPTVRINENTTYLCPERNKRLPTLLLVINTDEPTAYSGCVWSKSKLKTTNKDRQMTRSVHNHTTAYRVGTQ
jgi:hypothetical protein